MADISNVKRFKEINDTDNILVKEIDIFKKSTYTEIANTVQKYIDIETEIENVLAKRSVFFDTFLERGISPYMRMTCDVQILDDIEKTVRLLQRPLSANGELRFQNISASYMEKAILEVVIESFPEEIIDRSEWRVEDIDTPLSIKIRRKEAQDTESSKVLLSDITFERPYKFIYGTFNRESVWSPVVDNFLGRVEAYGAATGLDGYVDYTPFDNDAYLRFISSTSSEEELLEKISRSKVIDIRKNNISKKIYTEENPTGSPSNTLDGIDIEFGVSTVPIGTGINSLGVKLIKKIEIPVDIIYRPGSEDIGNIKYTFNKTRFGLEEFEEGVFLCASITSNKVYNSDDFPEFVRLFNITTSTFTIQDLLYRKDNPFNLDDSFFSKVTLSYTPHAAEQGKVLAGKFNVQSSIGCYAYPNTKRHLHKSDAEDMLPYPEPFNIDTFIVFPVSDSEEGVYISDTRNLDSYYQISDSSYSPGDVSVIVNRNDSGGPVVLGDHILEDRKGAVFYIVLGFIPETEVN